MGSDSLKPLGSLTQPDSRSRFLALSLERHYEHINGLALDPMTPEEIRRHFDVARNLLLFSWFVYEFIPSAELHAYSSVEFALRLRLMGESPADKVPGLKKLLERALELGWIADEGFQQYQRIERGRKESEALWAEIAGSSLSHPERTDPQAYAKIVIEGMPYFRNEFAHGTSYITPHGYLTLELCRDLIDQIFGQPAGPGGPGD